MNNNNNNKIITINSNGRVQQQMMNMIPNGMNMVNVNNGIPNPLGLTPNGMNPINQINAINQMNQMQLNGSAINLVQQQQQQNDNKNNQLLAATQSMINGIQSLPPPAIHLSVNNMAATTPIGKVKTFQFSNSNGNMNNNGAPTMIRTNSQSQLSPVYLPPLATTPRFTVPTPRGAAQYHTINLNNMNNINMNTASPIQIQQNGSNPPSVSMLAASNINGNLQIPSSMLKNANSVKNQKGDENKKDGKGKGVDNKENKDNKNIGNKNKMITPKTMNNGKGSLNAGAAPFLLNTTGVISPSISPRNLNRNRFVAPPPPPQSFAFPPPPLPQTANWLPVPPVLSATTPTNANAQHQQMLINNGLNQINMNPNKDMMNQNNLNHQNQINVSLVHNRGSPLFTPTQSPQFR